MVREISSSPAERFQSDEVPDHGVKRERWSPHADASDMSLGDVEHSQEHAQEQSRVETSENWDECENDEESHVDDVNGGFLDPEMVREARVEELAGYLKMQVYCRVPVAEIGSHKVIKARWVDTNKGDERSPEIRCQLVAKEVKKRNNTEEESANFFASTPPLEAVEFRISEAMTKRVSRNNRPLKLSFIDVKKAHLCKKSVA